MSEITIHPLQQARKKLGIKQKVLADLTGLSEPTIKRAERGELLSDYSVAQICEYFTQRYGHTVEAKDLGLHTQWEDTSGETPTQKERTPISSEEREEITATKDLPGYGERMYNETLDVIEHLIQQAWYMRRVAPKTETEKTTRRLHELFTHFIESLPPPSKLEYRFLQLYAQVKRLNAIMHIENQEYSLALTAFIQMYDIAKQLDDPSALALALMGIGTELERAGCQQQAVERLEEARDVSFNASKQVAGVVNAYLARAYASNGDVSRFNRAIDTAQNIATKLGNGYGNGTDYVFHRMSGILAERSYGYLELKEPKKTLDMKDEITQQIDLTHNTWLHAWIPLDWARAYLMINEIEESVHAGLEFFHRTLILQSPHAISRAYKHLIDLENAGYCNLQVVRDFRDELTQHSKETKQLLPPRSSE